MIIRFIAISPFLKIIGRFSENEILGRDERQAGIGSPDPVSIRPDHRFCFSPYLIETAKVNGFCPGSFDGQASGVKSQKTAG
jgi:hypothetical protein